VIPEERTVCNKILFHTDCSSNEGNLMKIFDEGTACDKICSSNEGNLMKIFDG
jgi:hypothetical protein